MADCFVVLPPADSNGCVVFGKNAHRPAHEVQEVIYQPSQCSTDGSKVRCTYIEVEQVKQTIPVILSKPAWTWGAEMGANDHGVCIGNSPVWNKLVGPDDLKERLLGQDLVRLGLERSKSAKEAVETIIDLLAKYGQGGPCTEEPASTEWSYQNSFLIVDGNDAWVLETAGKYWVAENIKDGTRNISNQLSIGTKYDMASPNLVEESKMLNLYKEEDGPFHFAQVFGENDSYNESSCPNRFEQGKKMLQDLSKDGKFGVEEMMKILRDEESLICMSGSFVTVGSQISILSPGASKSPSCHWFTATPNPKISIYKPFIFCPNASIGELTKSPKLEEEDSVQENSTGKKQISRKHALIKAQEKLWSLLDKDDAQGHMIIENLKELESKCVEDMNEILTNFDEKSCMRVAQVFDHICNIELNFYR